MKRNNILFALALTGALAAGCVKEDYSICPEGLWVAFDAQNSKHVYADHVRKLSLYFYDPATDSLVADFHYDRAELRAEDRAAFIAKPPVGDFRVLAIVNDGIYTITAGTEKYSTVHTTLDGYAMDAEPVALFSAETRVSVPQYQAAVPTVNMSLAKHTNNIHLHLVYDRSEEDGYTPTEGTDLAAWIEADNHRFDYKQYFSPAGGYLVSRPWYRADNGGEHALPAHPATLSMSTMRLWHGGDITLHIAEQTPGGATTRAGEPGLRTASVDIDDYLRQVIREEREKDVPGDYPYDTDSELEYHDQYHIYIVIKGYGIEAVNPDPTDPTSYYIVRTRNWDYVPGTIIVG